MPLIVAPSLPAAAKLSAERHSILPPGSTTPDLRIGLVNLMPLKQETEFDLLRMLAPSGRIIEPMLINMASHRSRNTDPEHIRRFYSSMADIDAYSLDALIITGAPLERVHFTDVDYWPEITAIFDLASARALPTLYICWAAYAKLYHDHRLPMHLLVSKISGVFPHTILRPEHPLLKGIEGTPAIPHSRFASWDPDELRRLCPEITTLLSSPEAGPYLLRDESTQATFVTGHVEYHRRTLANEYARDMARGLNPHIPSHYFPADDPEAEPVDNWRSTGLTLFSNWINSLATNR